MYRVKLSLRDNATILWAYYASHAGCTPYDWRVVSRQEHATVFSTLVEAMHMQQLVLEEFSEFSVDIEEVCTE